MLGPVDFFFYGTLRDAGIRRIVLGAEALSLSVVPATLEGYRCAPVERGRFPGIVAERGAAAPGVLVRGVLVRGVSLDAAARTGFFESEGSLYDIAREPLAAAGGRDAEAWVYVAAAALPVEAGEWRFEEWRRRWRPAVLGDARAAMARATPAELGRYRRVWSDRLGRFSPDFSPQS